MVLLSAVDDISIVEVRDSRFEIGRGLEASFRSGKELAPARSVERPARSIGGLKDLICV